MLLLQLVVLGEFLVQILYEHGTGVVGRAALDPLVYSIEGLAIDRQDTNKPALDHPVEVAGPRLLHLFGRDGELLTLRRRGGRLFCGCRIGRAGEKGARECGSGADGQPRASSRMGQTVYSQVTISQHTQRPMSLFDLTGNDCPALKA